MIKERDNLIAAFPICVSSKDQLKISISVALKKKRRTIPTYRGGCFDDKHRLVQILKICLEIKKKKSRI